MCSTLPLAVLLLRLFSKFYLEKYKTNKSISLLRLCVCVRERISEKIKKNGNLFNNMMFIKIVKTHLWNVIMSYVKVTRQHFEWSHLLCMQLLEHKIQNG